jgi:hypothetical protein
MNEVPFEAVKEGGWDKVGGCGVTEIRVAVGNTATLHPIARDDIHKSNVYYS